VTISTTSSSVTYQGNGATTVFPFGFLIPTGSLVVTLTDTTLPVPVSTNLPSNAFSVIGLDNPNGGSVTYNPGAPMIAGQALTIRRVLSPLQGTSLTNQGGFYPASVENCLDYLTMLVQQGAEALGRSIQVAVDDPAPALLPPAATRANQALVFDGSGNPIAGSVPNIPVSAAMAPVVQAATAAAARSALGSGTTGDALFQAATAAAARAITGALLDPGAQAGDVGKAIVVTGAGTYGLSSIASGLFNRVINGDMRIAQRSTGITGRTSAGAYTYWTIDRFGSGQDASGAAVFTEAQTLDHPVLGASGFSRKFTITTAKGTVGATDYLITTHRIEGYNVIDLFSAGAIVSVDFWVKSPKTGQHYFSLRNATPDRSYVAAYTVNAANTWERKTVQVNLANAAAAGTWNFTTLTGLEIVWPLFAGSTFQTASTGAWLSGNFIAGPGQQNLADTVNNAFQITDVQFVPGSSVTNFERRGLSDELVRCYRYAQPCNLIFIFQPAGAGSVGIGGNWGVQFRAAPTVPAPSLTNISSNGSSFSAAAWYLAGGAAAQGYTSISYSGTAQAEL
jgi:hypothetical protein